MPLDGPYPSSDARPAEQSICSKKNAEGVTVDLNILCPMLSDESYGCDKGAAELLQGYECTPQTGTEPVFVNSVKRGCGLEEVHLQTPGGIIDRTRTFEASTGKLVGAVEHSDIGWGACNVSKYTAGTLIDSCADTTTMNCVRTAPANMP